jgi:hypothetical protein
MHFFITNLLYYLQVDVIDSEYNILLIEIYNTINDFQYILKIQKQFLSNVIRLSYINNISIQENFDRILQICLRFIAICRILHNIENNNNDNNNNNDDNNSDYNGKGGLNVDNDFHRNNNINNINNINNNNNRNSRRVAKTLPIYIPPEEFIFIKKDFFQQISLLLHIMKKVDSRGFLFRLDFNGFLSSATI